MFPDNHSSRTFTNTTTPTHPLKLHQCTKQKPLFIFQLRKQKRPMKNEFYEKVINAVGETSRSALGVRGPREGGGQVMPYDKSI